MPWNASPSRSTTPVSRDRTERDAAWRRRQVVLIGRTVTVAASGAPARTDRQHHRVVSARHLDRGRCQR